VRPLSWSEWPKDARRVFQGFRSSAGEEMVLDKNVFVEAVLPGSILRKLTDSEMETYREPFRDPGEAGRPTQTWPREIPVDGEPADVCAIVCDCATWLSQSEVPKLFINAEPGAILTGAPREWVRTWPHKEDVTAAGIHFLQEDSPEAVGEAVADWYGRKVKQSRDSA